MSIPQYGCCYLVFLHPITIKDFHSAYNLSVTTFFVDHWVGFTPNQIQKVLFTHSLTAVTFATSVIAMFPILTIISIVGLATTITTDAKVTVTLAAPSVCG